MLAIHKGPVLGYCMAIHSAASRAAMLPCCHAARLNGHREMYQISDPEATERHLTFIGNTEGSLQDADGRIYDDIIE